MKPFVCLDERPIPGRLRRNIEGGPQRRNSRISIGSNPPGGHDPYNGLVGSIMIYNRPLTPPEASLLYVGTRLKFR